MTADEFLAWEARQELKYEFDGFEPIARTGGTLAHSIITVNLLTALNIGLRGKRCRAAGPDLKVQTDGSFRYPDASVFCAEAPLDAVVAPEPIVVFEVLSPSTAREDRTTKMREYLSLASLQRYVMLEQEQAFANVVARTGSGWSIAQLGPDGTLEMPEIEISVPMADIYAGLEFAPEARL
jgi:Uma2 family endonuclease